MIKEITAYIRSSSDSNVRIKHDEFLTQIKWVDKNCNYFLAKEQQVQLYCLHLIYINPPHLVSHQGNIFMNNCIKFNKVKECSPNRKVLRSHRAIGNAVIPRYLQTSPRFFLFQDSQISYISIM